MIIDAPRPAQEAALRALWCEAFGDDGAFLDAFWQTAYSPDRCFCITLKDEVASALYWLDSECRGERIAYIYAVATAKRHRGKGLCHQLMLHTHTHLQALGYAGAILVPSGEELFFFYGKMGYSICSYIREFDCESKEQHTELICITAAEYAQYRRQMLPAGGVVQEGAALALLQTGATFYRGKDFLLAASLDKGHLMGVELLGNAAAAPGILHALGCAAGRFRTVGNDRPFAMYLSLSGNADAPRYFGLAFD